MPLLKEGEGRLVQVTTTATAHPWPGLSVYTATKAAIEAFRWETVTLHYIHCITQCTLHYI